MLTLQPLNAPLRARFHETWFHHSAMYVDNGFAATARELYDAYAAKTEPDTTIEGFLEYLLIALYHTGVDQANTIVRTVDVQS